MTDTTASGDSATQSGFAPRRASSRSRMGLIDHPLMSKERKMTLSRESRRILDETNVKPWNMESAVKQIQSCQFECEGGSLENNTAWRWIVMTYGIREPRTGSLD